MQASSPLTSTPRKPSSPFQLWREEHLRQEAGTHEDRRSSGGQEVRRSSGGQDRRSVETPGRKHPPTRLYIEEEPDKKVETYQRWRQQQREKLSSESVTNQSDTRHLSELERQIEAVQRSERERQSTLSAESEPATAATTSAAAVEQAVRSKKKDKRGSISSILNVFRGKKSRNTPTPPPKKKKSSLGVMMEREAGSVLDPSAHQKIIEKPEPERAKSPYQLWRERRESGERKDPPSDISELKLDPRFLRTPSPDPDYDNLSYKSTSPRLPRESPRAPREHQYLDENYENSSDTSCDDAGRLTPRSSAGSEYGRNIPRYQPLPNLIMGYGRGVSPANSEASVNHSAKRSPSTDSFFGKNGASVGGAGSSSQIWYQKYKHSSFSHHNQSGVFGDTLYGAFDGRISKFRGKTFSSSIRRNETEQRKVKKRSFTSL